MVLARAGCAREDRVVDAEANHTEDLMLFDLSNRRRLRTEHPRVDAALTALVVLVVLVLIFVPIPF